jgi:hypothetical protein
MSTTINTNIGGGLHWESSIGTQQLNADIQEIKNKLSQLGNTGAKEGQKLESGLGASMKRVWEVMGGVSFAGLLQKGLGLIKAGFSSIIAQSEKLTDRLEVFTSGASAAFGVLGHSIANAAVSMTGSADNVTEKSTIWGNTFAFLAKSSLTSFNVITMGLSHLIPGYNSLNDSIDNTAEKMNNAATAAKQYTAAMQDLRKEDIAQIAPRAQALEQISEARSKSQDETIAIKDRIKYLKDAIELETKQTQIDLDNQTKKVSYLQALKISQIKTGGTDAWAASSEKELNLQQEIAKLSQIQTESYQAQFRAKSQVRALTDQEFAAQKAFNAWLIDQSKNTTPEDKFKGSYDAQIQEEKRYQDQKIQILVDATNKAKGIEDKATLDSIQAETEKNLKQAETIHNGLVGMYEDNKTYNDKIQELDSSYAVKKSNDRYKTDAEFRTQVDKNYKKQQEDLQTEHDKTLKSYDWLYTSIEEMGRNSIVKSLQIAKETRNQLQSGKTPLNSEGNPMTADEIEKLKQRIRELEGALKSLNEQSIETWKNWGDSFAELTSGFQNLADTTGNALVGNLAKVSGGVTNAIEGFTKMKETLNNSELSTGQKVTASIGGILSMISIMQTVSTTISGILDGIFNKPRKLSSLENFIIELDASIARLEKLKGLVESGLASQADYYKQHQEEANNIQKQIDASGYKGKTPEEILNIQEKIKNMINTLRDAEKGMDDFQKKNTEDTIAQMQAVIDLGDKDIAILTENSGIKKQIAEDEYNTQLNYLNLELINVQKGSQEELNIKEQQIEEQRKLDIENANNTIKDEQLRNSKIAEINGQAQADKAALEEQYREARFQAEITYEQNITNTKLLYVKKGSEEELKLKKELIQEQEKLDLEAAEKQLELVKSTAEKTADFIAAMKTPKVSGIIAAVTGTDTGTTGTSAEIEAQAAIDAIKAKAAAEQAILDREYQQAQTASRLTAEQDVLNKELLFAKAGSAKELELKKNLIAEQEALDLANARNTITNNTELQAKIALIAAKAKLDQKALDDEYNKAKAAAADKAQGEYYAKQEKLAAAAAAKQKAIDDANLEAKKKYQDLVDLMLGTTPQNFADAIKQGLEQGKPFAQLFGDNLNSVLRNAILQSMEMKILQPQIDAMMADIGKRAAQPGGLSNYDVEYIQRHYGAGSAFQTNLQSQAGTVNSLLNMLPGATGTTAAATAPTGMSGRLAQASEETVGLLAGQLNDMRIDNKTALAYAFENLTVLNKIETHTFVLHEIRDILREGGIQTLRAVGA